LAERTPRPGAAAASAVWGNALAFAISLPMALPVVGATTQDWLVLGYLGTFQIGLAYYLISRAVRTVSALDTALLLLLEPVLNPILVWWLHGETLRPIAFAGAALVLAATAWRTLAAPQPDGQTLTQPVQEA
jgi:drug/metabolite transporter (DMT)-like permease